MKTVQEWLREVDLKELTNLFFWAHPIDFKMLPDSDLSIREIRSRAQARFQDYVERMRVISLPQVEPADEIFFASREFREGFQEICVHMCYISALKQDAEPQCYSWILTDHAEVMGYWIAETELTINNILNVLVEILYETSFFGYTQEAITQEREHLMQSEKEIEQGETYTAEELRKRLGLPPDVRDSDEEELVRKVRAAEYDYSSFCTKRELGKLRERLKGTN